MRLAISPMRLADLPAVVAKRFAAGASSSRDSELCAEFCRSGMSRPRPPSCDFRRQLGATKFLHNRPPRGGDEDIDSYAKEGGRSGATHEGRLANVPDAALGRTRVPIQYGGPVALPDRYGRDLRNMQRAVKKKGTRQKTLRRNWKT